MVTCLGKSYHFLGKCFHFWGSLITLGWPQFTMSNPPNKSWQGSEPPPPFLAMPGFLRLLLRPPLPKTPWPFTLFQHPSLPWQPQHLPPWNVTAVLIHPEKIDIHKAQNCKWYHDIIFLGRSLLWEFLGGCPFEYFLRFFSPNNCTTLTLSSSHFHWYHSSH